LMKIDYKYIIGIDEAGRGPLAGPVAVGAVLFEKDEYEKFVAGKGRSSRSVAERGGYVQGKVLDNNDFRFSVAFSSNKVIDTKGIVRAIDMAIEKIFAGFKLNPEECLILLDGNLKAPKEFKNQKTIIKGDEKEPVISLASIVAKVSRDMYIVKLSEKYREFGFEQHKGYGTKLHYEMIEKHGLCNIHRRTFLKKLSN
jgi:ribonuclease HII